MSLATQITAAFQAVASAMGKEQDWATSFTSKLTTATGATASSKTVPGIVQLATAAQTLAGVDDTAAITSADLASIRATQTDVFAGTAGLLVPPSALAGGVPGHRRYATIAAMNTDTTSMDGALASVPSFTTTNGTVLASTWRRTNGYWYPFGHLKCLNAATLADLKSYPTTYPNISFDPRFTNALVISDGATAANGWDEYMWIGSTTGFYLWNGAANITYASGYSDYATSTLNVHGGLATLNMQVQHANSPTYTTIITTDSRAKPVSERVFAGGVNTSGSGWSYANYAIQNTGTVLALNLSGTGNAQYLEGTVTYRRQVPTV